MKQYHIPLLTIICALLLITGCQETTYSANLQTGFETETDLSGFTRATESDYIQFPRDLGAHDDFQTEWWYYTGNVETQDGRQFGYQFTLFRRAIAPPSAEYDGNRWRTGQIYFAHAAIADIETGEFLFGDRFSRGGADLAGAETGPYEIWIDNWSVTEIAPGVHKMVAEESGVGFEFQLTETQPPVLQGNGGLSPKSTDVSYASYYYSLVGMETTGEIKIGADRYEVSGKSWMDHEIGTDFLPDGVIGWNWFAAQFDNGQSLMLAQTREQDDQIQYGFGSWIDQESHKVDIEMRDFELEVLETWTSPNTGATYPAKWRLSYPAQNLELTIETMIDNAELLVISTIYWEGPARFEGTLNGEPISGVGYIELTGYVDPINF